MDTCKLSRVLLSQPRPIKFGNSDHERKHPCYGFAELQVSIKKHHCLLEWTFETVVRFGKQLKYQVYQTSCLQSVLLAEAF